MKKNLLYALALATSLVACTDDYTDWAAPQQNDPEEAQSVVFAASPAAAIDFATVESESVQLFVPSVTAAEGATSTFSVVLYNADKSANSTMAADANGSVDAAELESIINSLYGRRPEARTVEMNISAFTSINGQSIKNVASTTATITPEAPVISANHYLIGAPSTWDVADTSLKFNHSGKDVYDDPNFTIVFPVTDGEYWFAVTDDITVEQGDWSYVFGCAEGNGANGMEGKLDRRSNLADDGSWKVVVEGDAKFIKMTINMLEYTYKLEKLNFEEFVYVPGNHQGWNPATAPALRSPAFDGVYTGYAYMDGEFKFTTKRDWSGEYNSGSFTSAEGDVELGDAGANIKMTGTGVYMLKADIPSGKLTATATAWGIIGDATPGGWDTDTDMTWNAEKKCLAATITLTDGTIKFRANDGWDINFGGDPENLSEGGDNIAVTAGTYDIELYLERTDTDKIYCVITKK